MVLPGQGNSLVEHVAHRALSAGLYLGQLSLPHARPDTDTQASLRSWPCLIAPTRRIRARIWHAVLLKAYGVMCVGEVVNMYPHLWA